MTKRRLLLVAVAAAALLLVGRVAAALYADYAWYASLGASALWRAKLWNTLLLRGSAWLAGTGFVFANLLAVRGSVLKLVVPRRVANLEIDAEVPGRLLIGGAAIVSVGVGALLALAQDDWTTLATARYAMPFHDWDPYFEKDFAFWTAFLPLEQAWYGWAQMALVLVSALVVTLYALTSSLRWERGGLRVASYVRRHLAALAALLLLLLAWSYRLERFRLVVDGGSAGYFGYVEHGSLGPLFALSLITAACAVLVFWAGYVGQVRLALAGVALAIVAAIGLQQVAPLLIRWNARVRPADETEQYLETRTGYTQRAYGVRGGLAEGDSTVSFASVAALAGHVSLWDEETLITAAERGGRRRDVIGRVGWRADEDGRIAALLAAREGAPETDDGTQWVAVEVAASEMEPVSHAPPLTTHELPRVLVQPGAGGYLVVDDPDSAVAGGPMRGAWQRLAHALAVQNLRLLAEGRGRSAPRFVDHRELRERVRRLAPVFEQGAEPTPLLLADSLYWAVHLYATSTSYPLSQPLAVRTGSEAPVTGVKYFHHAATAVVNAHTGRVRIYRVREPDPLAASWMARFPGVYRGWDGAPAGLRAAIPPPVESVVAKAVTITMAGWVGAAPATLRMPERDRDADSTARNVALVPFALSGTENVAVALPLVGRADERLKLLLLGVGGADARTVALSIESPAAPWPAIADSLRAATAAVAAAADPAGGAARGQAGGDVRALPLARGAAYLRTGYADAADGPPTLAAVALFANDSVRAGPTLDAALGLAPASDDALPDDPAALWRAMRDALRRADWSAFGEAFDRLGRVLGGGGR